MSNQAVIKPHPKNKDFFYLYLKKVPVVYANVQAVKKKYQSEEKEFCLTAFVNDETRTYLEEEVILNKILSKVGKDKNKKKQIKYPTSKQHKDGANIYDAFEGLNGINLSLSELKKNGELNTLTVVDKDGNVFTDLVGNGSICSIKCFGYRNEDDMLNISLDIVQVLEHIPYEGGDGSSFNDEELGISYQVGAKKVGKVEEKVDHFNDDIPF